MIPATERYKAYPCHRLMGGKSGLNPAEDMNVPLMCLLCGAS